MNAYVLKSAGNKLVRVLWKSRDFVACLMQVIIGQSYHAKIRLANHKPWQQDSTPAAQKHGNFQRKRGSFYSEFEESVVWFMKIFFVGIKSTWEYYYTLKGEFYLSYTVSSYIWLRTVHYLVVNSAVTLVNSEL